MQVLSQYGDTSQRQRAMPSTNFKVVSTYKEGEYGDVTEYDIELPSGPGGRYGDVQVIQLKVTTVDHPSGLSMGGDRYEIKMGKPRSAAHGGALRSPSKPRVIKRKTGKTPVKRAR